MTPLARPAGGRFNGATRRLKMYEIRALILIFNYCARVDNVQRNDIQKLDF